MRRPRISQATHLGRPKNPDYAHSTAMLREPLHIPTRLRAQVVGRLEAALYMRDPV